VCKIEEKEQVHFAEVDAGEKARRSSLEDGHLERSWRAQGVKKATAATCQK
jgi:hypothetical protein